MVTWIWQDVFWITATCPSHPSARHGVVSSVSAIRKVSYAFQAWPSRMPRVPPRPADQPPFLPKFRLPLDSSDLCEWPGCTALDVHYCWHRTVMGLMSTYTSSRSSWHNSWRGSSGATFAASCLLELEYPFNCDVHTARTTVNWEPNFLDFLEVVHVQRKCSSQGKRHKSRSAEKCGHAVWSSWDCRWNQMFFSNCPFLFWGPVSSLIEPVTKWFWLFPEYIGDYTTHLFFGGIIAYPCESQRTRKCNTCGQLQTILLLGGSSQLVSG